MSDIQRILQRLGIRKEGEFKSDIDRILDMSHFSVLFIKGDGFATRHCYANSYREAIALTATTDKLILIISKESDDGLFMSFPLLDGIDYV